MIRSLLMSGVVLCLTTATVANAQAPADSSRVTPAPVPLDRSIRVSASMGLSYYAAPFSGVDEAFHAIERSYQAQGVALTPAPDASNGVLLAPTITVGFGPYVEVSCQLGRTVDAKNQVRMIGANVTARQALPSREDLSVFAGLGGGAFGFRFQRDYGAFLSSDPGGGYTTLDNVRLRGGGNYWTALAGITLRRDSMLGFEATIQYFGMEKVSEDSPRAGRMTIGARGLALGGSLRCYF